MINNIPWSEIRELTGDECGPLSVPDMEQIVKLAEACEIYIYMHEQEQKLVWPDRAKYTFEDGKYIRHG